MLLTGENYDTLILAGRTAAYHLEEPIEAFDLFERAIEKESSRTKAYEEQLALLAASATIAPLRTLYEKEGLRLDGVIWRDWKKLRPDECARQEVAFVRYLVWRGHVDQALELAYPRLFDEDGRYSWWKIGLNRAYAWALVERAHQSLAGGREEGRAHLEQAESQLQRVRDALKAAREQCLFDTTDLLDHGDAIDALTVDMHRLRKKWFANDVHAKRPPPSGGATSVDGQGSLAGDNGSPHEEAPEVKSPSAPGSDPPTESRSYDI